MLSRFGGTRLFVTPLTLSCQATPSMVLARQEHLSQLPFSPPGNLPHPGIEPTSLLSPALADLFFTTRATWKAHTDYN